MIARWRGFRRARTEDLLTAGAIGERSGVPQKFASRGPGLAARTFGVDRGVQTGYSDLLGEFLGYLPDNLFGRTLAPRQC